MTSFARDIVSKAKALGCHGFIFEERKKHTILHATSKAGKSVQLALSRSSRTGSNHRLIYHAVTQLKRQLREAA